MSSKKIVFRADGNKNTGLGHLYRIFALIEMVKEEFDFVFVSKQNSTLKIIPDNYKLKTFPEFFSGEEEIEWLSKNFPSADYKIVADGYQFDANYQKKIKSLGYHYTYIDDLVKGAYFCDIIINHAPIVTKNDYSVNSSCKFGLGADFALLRPAFIKAASEVARLIVDPKEAFVCFGGADANDLTIKAVQALLNFKQIKKINAVVGAAYEHTDIFDLEKKENSISVFKNLNETELFKLMLNCEFAIAPSSNILYELCSVKMPTLSGFYVDNQINIYQGFLSKGLIFGAGNIQNFLKEDFIEEIKKVLSINDYSPYLNAQTKIFNKGIKSRFLNLFSDVTYRNITKDDMMLVFEWSNDSVTRSNSFSDQKISIEEHQKWYTGKLSDNNSLYYICELNEHPAGLVRYDIKDDYSVIGIMMSDKYRGRNLAFQFLKETLDLYFDKIKKPVKAYIKLTNSASVKSFEKAGYKKISEENINGQESYIYQIEYNG